MRSSPYCLEQPIDGRHTRCSSSTCATSLLDPKLTARSARNKVIAQRDISITGERLSAAHADQQYQRSAVPADKAVVAYRQWLAKFDDLGWRIDWEEFQRRNDKQTAFAIPRRAGSRRTTWVVEAVPADQRAEGSQELAGSGLIPTATRGCSHPASPALVNHPRPKVSISDPARRRSTHDRGGGLQHQRPVPRPHSLGHRLAKRPRATTRPARLRQSPAAVRHRCRDTSRASRRHRHGYRHRRAKPLCARRRVEAPRLDVSDAGRGAGGDRWHPRAPTAGSTAS